MPRIPGLETQSRVQYRAPQAQASSSAQAKGMRDQAKYNLQQTQLQGALGIAEQLARLFKKHKDNQDAVAIANAQNDWYNMTTGFENGYLSDTTAYRTKELEGVKADADPETLDKINSAQEYISILEEEKNAILAENELMHHSGERIVDDPNSLRLSRYNENLRMVGEYNKWISEKQEEVGTYAKTLPDHPSNTEKAYHYQVAGDEYLKMVSEFESRWGLDGSKPENGLSKSAMEKFRPWLEKEKIKTGDFVHDKSTLYGLRHDAYGMKEALEDNIKSGDLEGLTENARVAVEQGIMTPMEADNYLDAGYYSANLDEAMSYAMTLMGTVEFGSYAEKWYGDPVAPEQALAWISANTTYTNHDGKTISFAEKDVAKIADAVNKQAELIRETHQRWRRNETYAYVNRGLDLFYRGALTMGYIDDIRGEAYDGGPYGQGGGGEFLRKLLERDRDGKYFPNPVARTQVWDLMGDARISDETLDVYINQNFADWGLNKEELFEFKDWVEKNRPTLMGATPDAYDGLGFLKTNFDNALSQAEKDGDYNTTARLRVKYAEAMDRYHNHIVNNLNNDPQYYNTKAGKEEIQGLAGQLVRYYLDEELSKQLDNLKGTIHTNVGGILDGQTLNKLEKAIEFFDEPGSAVFRQEYSEILIGIESAIGRNWARVTGSDAHTFIKADNKVEVFDRNVDPGGKYVRWNSDAQANGISYTYKTENKRLAQYVFDPDLNDWVKVTEGMPGVRVVDFYARETGWVPGGGQTPPAPQPNPRDRTPRGEDIVEEELSPREKVIRGRTRGM